MNGNKSQNIYDNDNGFIKALRKGVLLVACRVCGQVDRKNLQCHPKESAHLYDYEGTVDDDLICHLCFQPFVDPVDSKCGCTFCSICLQNYLLRFKYCPIDNQKIDWKYCHKASQALRRIIEKLLVVCPNIDYCEEVLPRHLLQTHLMTKCKGSVTYCSNASIGCEFQGPRSVLSNHLLDCPYKNKISDIAKEQIIPGKFCQIEIHRGNEDIGISIVGGCDTPLIFIKIQIVLIFYNIKHLIQINFRLKFFNI
ncbi:ligand of Numb X 2-like isoform X1 [Brachionus plicatilis]|uniref:Ligand of Numb X 2-like isoform X1 n=1 Tax=Brachionus plicatilis TaxID=10195 RepID=A0A3M7PA80_BRAPC|nr:ligand of Numb X 2-like isoform X1 [Brachionus plicatilis]